jgi:RNA polymerase sigma factor (sigma-70 family)
MQRPTSTAPDQFNRVFGEQRQGHILAAMEELSRDHREILSLRYYSDLSYAEIADTLAIKLGTVMSRLSRAKGRLMEAIGDPGVIES